MRPSRSVTAAVGASVLVAAGALAVGQRRAG